MTGFGIAPAAAAAAAVYSYACVRIALTGRISMIMKENTINTIDNQLMPAYLLMLAYYFAFLILSSSGSSVYFVRTTLLLLYR